MMTLQACTLKHSIKKEIFSVLAKMNLFRSGRRESSLLLPHLRTCIFTIVSVSDNFSMQRVYIYLRLSTFIAVEIPAPDVSNKSFKKDHAHKNGIKNSH